MTDQNTKAEAFRALHVKGTPLILWNIWDAGSAKAVAEAGASAIATGSWSMAAAQGFADGEALPLETLLNTAAQIVGAVDQPVSVDFEGGYADAPEALAQNVARLMKVGVVGLNFEDRIVAGKGLHDIEHQAARIAAIRAAAQAAGLALFINARTDVFFAGSKAPQEELLAEALTRAQAYAQAGADGFFVPGVSEIDLVAQLAAGQPLPLNIMRMGKAAEIAELATAGAARISHGPGPYMAAMKALGAEALI